MAVTPSGTISMSNLNTALGRSSTASISMSDPQIYLLAGNATSGTIAMGSVRGITTFNGTITADAFDDKGNIYYGTSTGLYGSSTGTFYGYSISDFYSYPNGDVQYLITSPPGGIPNTAGARWRIRVGTGAVVESYQYDPIFPGRSINRSGSNLIVAADVGLTKNWQVVRYI